MKSDTVLICAAALIRVMTLHINSLRSPLVVAHARSARRSCALLCARACLSKNPLIPPPLVDFFWQTNLLSRTVLVRCAPKFQSAERCRPTARQRYISLYLAEPQDRRRPFPMPAESTERRHPPLKPKQHTRRASLKGGARPRDGRADVRFASRPTNILGYVSPSQPMHCGASQRASRSIVAADAQSDQRYPHPSIQRLRITSSSAFRVHSCSD